MNRKILALAIPNIVTNITIPLLGMVDIGLMGHMGSAVYLGAIAIGTMIFNIIFWGFSFLRMGTSGFTAQAYGSRNLNESVLILCRSLLVGLAGSIALILLQYPIAWIAFKLVNSTTEVESLARQYFYIRIYAAPATLCIYSLTGWFIGMQNAKSPMILAISVNILNIIFSLIFIKIAHMNSDGIALANVCSQCIGLLFGLFLIRPYFRKLKKYLIFKDIFNVGALRHFLNVNKDIFIRTLCLIFTFSFFTTQSANTSDTILAVNTLLFQFLFFFSYFADGFAYAAEALTGRYIGSGDLKMLKRVIHRLFTFGTLIAVVFTIIYLLAGRTILGLLTNNEQLIASTQPYVFWIVLLPLISFAAFIWDGIYIGATASKAMRNSMLIITFGIFLPVYFAVKQSMGNHGLWLAMLLFMGSRGIFLTFMAGRTIFGYKLL